MHIEQVEADVLCIGGGICGLMAAIRASELGAAVVVAEKGNTLRSGAAATGCDHFSCYIPDVHGTDFDAFLKAKQRANPRGAAPSGGDIQRVLLEKSFDIVKLWQRWGIPMKYQGRYEFAGHGLPGHVLSSLKYAGQSQKLILTKEALKRGVKIVNRVMVLDLLVSDGVAGAVGVHTREDKMIVFRAKSAVLGTGTVNRLYPGLTPGWLLNTQRPATLSGDGRVMAFRAGADLCNLETTAHHSSTKYFAKSGVATYVGVLRDPQGKPIGPFVTRPDSKYGDPMIDMAQSIYMDYARSGKGPVYLDFSGISDEDHDYMMHWMPHEGLSAMVDHFKEEGIDTRKNAIEFTTYPFRGSGGNIRRNAKAETSLKGLYAAGDETGGGGIAGAATFGWIAGDNAARYAGSAAAPDIGREMPRIENQKESLTSMRARTVGPDWEEVNIALQHTMLDYAGFVRSETLLDAGLRHLRRIRDKAHATMIACSQHDLVRGLETLNLLDLGELVFMAAKERKETRGLHVRADYPYANPLLDATLVVKKSGGVTVTEWK
ncbi:MAG: FAD-binding protein [Desulfobacterales bacterium]|nr:FAD-binding protein [Desulfobacterales bacterium]